MKECDPAEQTARQDLLERLYHEDGRQQPDHPMHGVYTGLVCKQEGGDDA